MELNGLPLHPLVVHVALAVVALAAACALLQALLPAWRWVTRWSTPGLALVSVGVVLVTRASGEALLEARPFLSSAAFPQRDTLRAHQDRADVLLWAVVALAAVAVLAWFVLPARSPLRSERLAHEGAAAPWATWAVVAGLVGTAVVALLWLFLTGDAGARAVWSEAPG